MGKIRKFLPNIIVTIMLVVGIGLLSYPTVSDFINELHSSKSIGSYVENTENLSKEQKDKMLKEAREYNKELLYKNNRYHLNQEEKNRYNSILDVTDTGIMGYMEIPKLNIYIPIYHGVDEGTLQIAAGHIPGSSLPVGGESTHSLISGHTGLPSAKLLTDMDQLKEGDIFLIYVLDEVLAYKVNQIKTVLPSEVDSLDIEQGKDYVTLVTCTPYGVNSHRLLVQGERTEYNGPRQDINDVIRKTNMKLIVILVVGVTGVVCLVLAYLMKRRRR